MKVKDIRGYVNPTIIENFEIPISHIVVQDEFSRSRIGDKKVDPRVRAVDRLIDMKVPFDSEWNTAFNVAGAFLKGECPYCHGPMDIHHGGGSGSHINIKFRCTNNECGASGSIRVDWDAVSIEPPKKGKYNPQE